ncbi:MAG: arginine--tRNA ligase [Patescibacteria group bacterium]
MTNSIKMLLKEALTTLGIEAGEFSLEHPNDLKNGDYSTNVAIRYGHKEEILEYLQKNKPDEIEKIELAGPGFINFYLSKEFFKKSLGEIIKKDKKFGKGEHARGFKIMVEHTDPNPFKEFHIGHLMPNVIGSTLSRVFEWNGAEVKQANYQGDAGLHVAKAIWGILKGEKDPYVFGTKAFEQNDKAKEEIQEINKRIYDKSDPEINKVYKKGRQASLDEFEKVYKRLGSKFDYYFFESETSEVGKKIVLENLEKVFEKGEGGAIVFKGEKFDPSLHTRVFINSQGLPTYEAKDLGNAKNKYDKYHYDFSVVVTGNEIKDYFRVVLEAMKQVLPDLAKKTKHLPHGMLRLTTGKMSSRTGDVITAEELIEDVKKKVKNNEALAVGAIKYMILRQAIGNDIIFDIEKSVSTEGDSGVYLQYAYARTNSLLEKADKKADPKGSRENFHEIERLLYRFPEVVERAGHEYAPHYITTYLTELAGSFNNFYAHEQVIGDSPESAYRLAVVKAFNIVMKNGLDILGIPTPERI